MAAGVQAIAAGVMALACLAGPAGAVAASIQAATIYPSGPTVPENLLRIEVRFQEALKIPLDIGNVKLLDAEGHEIADAFLDLPLPSADGHRVTLLMHPGRVKSGVGANLRLGRALHPGEEITLVIRHPSLARPVEKSWRVGAFAGSPPLLRSWRIEPPHAGGREPVVVRLDAPISSTADVLIAVRDPSGRRLAGRASLDEGETVWRLTPSHAWTAGDYAVVVHPDLEDAAGNRVCAAFEQVGESRASCDAAAELAFTVR